MAETKEAQLAEAEAREKEDQLEDDRRKANPLSDLEIDALRTHVYRLYTSCFEGKDSATEEELQIGATLARNYGYHPIPTKEDEEAREAEGPFQRKYTPSVDSASQLLERRDWGALRIQESKKFWKEPKDLLITILACCMASMTQGWDQVANGNLGWPKALHVTIERNGAGGPDVWTFGAVNAITWFSAAILGPCIVDPICYSRYFGRRGSVFLAACFSLASPIAASRVTSWEGLFIARLFLGVGIGAKASIVPIWESEVLPPGKRGRGLVSWQVFTAVGIFAGSVATYIFRDYWRTQILSGALPALILFVLVYLGSESPRWLIIQGKYVDAFETLVRLRKERVLAAEEFIYIYFQIQTERALARKVPRDEITFNHFQPAVGYGERLPKVVTISRNRRAAFASMIVMLSQQLSGINILAFLASIFFTAANLTTDENDSPAAIKRNLGLGIGFGAANAIFSAIAFWVIEPLPHDLSVEDLDEEIIILSTDDPSTKKEKLAQERKKRQIKLRKLLYGRRRLLLQSLAGGTATLFILTFLLRLPRDNPHKLGAVTAFVFLFTLFYSPGAGAVPFLYSAEIWPNEGREVGMSWGVFWNFLGSGFLALFVPRGLDWSSPKLFGIFTGLSFFGFLLVYLFVPGTDEAQSLEDMSEVFSNPLSRHAVDKLAHLGEVKNFRHWFPYTIVKRQKVPMPASAPTAMQGSGLQAGGAATPTGGQTASDAAGNQGSSEKAHSTTVTKKDGGQETQVVTGISQTVNEKGDSTAQEGITPL